MYKYLVLISVLLSSVELSFTQNNNIVRADNFTKLGNQFYSRYLLDSSTFYYQKAAKIYKQLAKENNDKSFSEKYYELIYYSAWNTSLLNQPKTAIELINNSLPDALFDLNKNNVQIANLYNGLGFAYNKLSKYKLALDYYIKALNIRLSIYGEENIKVANSYNEIGLVYRRMCKYKLALKNLNKSLEILQKKYGKKHIKLSKIYTNLSNLYIAMLEYDKALEYGMISLEIKASNYGIKHPRISNSYNSIGTIYLSKKEYNKALDYYMKAVSIETKRDTSKNIVLLRVYNNIAITYKQKKNYTKSLEFYMKSLDISNRIYKDENKYKAAINYNIGNIYALKNKYKDALLYYDIALPILKKNYGETHEQVASCYLEMGKAYKELGEDANAYQSFESCINASLLQKKTTTLSQLGVKNYIAWESLIQGLVAQAKLIEYSENLGNIYNLSTKNKRFNAALNYYLACDTLITIKRRESTVKSDKLSLAELANSIYSKAASLALKLNKKELAFQFSEKNKLAVLQSSLASTKALKFSGLEDSLVQQEKKLQRKIALYTQKLAQQPDSAKEVYFRSELFEANRAYENLIDYFEKNYPEYYNIKYNNKDITVAEIQNKLEKKSSLISYFTADSVIYISVLTNKTFDIKTVKKPKNFDRQIQMFQKGILSKIDKVYYHFGNSLYNTLIPKELIPNKIKNLIIIPDAKLTTIPFEALLSEKLTDKDIKYSELPYLAKDYSISYAYSAKLWLSNLADKQNIYENDFLALAPVFSDNKTAGTTLRTRSFFAKMDSTAYATDSISTRGRMLNGNYISALPATETEVSSIFELFKNKKMKAIVKTHKMANEEFVKSDSLSRSRIIHIATHGFVNEEKPELSGILLAQDTTQSSEDGILYSGEIYNLDLNAKLVVLSACETGLGQIKRGEGVIGLSRSLMYAGAENLIVSLWKVADKSTSELLINFYKEILKNKNNKSYHKQLHKAKLKMINSEKYSHPYYWSPFILIGY